MSDMPYDLANPPMMLCGHTANSAGTRAGSTERVPACVICSCFEQAKAAPNLEGRLAHCTYQRPRGGGEHPAPVPSSTSLAFFEYRPTEDSDRYYCGCWGWN